ncbi:MAG TPA: hypothetical protein VIV09_04745, partial [Pseudolabrys sp.]
MEKAELGNKMRESSLERGRYERENRENNAQDERASRRTARSNARTNRREEREAKRQERGEGGSSGGNEGVHNALSAGNAFIHAHHVPRTAKEWSGLQVILEEKPEISPSEAAAAVRRLRHR